MPALPKPRTARSKEYLEFIRRRACLVGCAAPVEAHHVNEKGKAATGKKTSDFRTVPLCRICHDSYHFLGREAFEALNKLDLEGEIIRLLAAFHRLPKRVKRKLDATIKAHVQVDRCICGRGHSFKPGSKKLDPQPGRIVKAFCVYKNQWFEVRI
jgi:hypothetical protein